MASVNVDYEEFNSLKVKEKELESLLADFDTKLTSKRKQMDDELSAATDEFKYRIVKNREDYDTKVINLGNDYNQKLSDFEKDKGIIVVEIKGHVVKEEWLLKDIVEDIEAYDFTKDLDLVKINEEIYRKTYVNLDSVLDPLRDELRESYENEYKAKFRKLTEIADTHVDAYNKHIEDHHIFLTEHDELRQDNDTKVSKISELKNNVKTLKSSKLEIMNNLISTEKDLESTKEDVVYYKDLLQTTKETLIEKNDFQKKLFEENVLELHMVQEENLSSVRAESEKLAQELSDEKAELKSKFNFDITDRVLIVKNYEDMSATNKWLLKKIYVKYDLHEANFSSDINRNKIKNEEFLNQLGS